MRTIFSKNAVHVFLTALFLLFASGAVSSTPYARTEQQTFDFVLKNARQKPFRLSEQRGKVLVFAFIPDTDDKKTGSVWLAQSRKWMQEIHQNFGDRLTIIGLKEMTDLPMFLPKSVIRVKLRKEPFPYLIDWEGTVFERFSVSDTFTLMVLDKNGRVAYRLSEPYNPEKCKAVCAKIEELLKDHKQTNTGNPEHGTNQ